MSQTLRERRLLKSKNKQQHKLASKSKPLSLSARFKNAVLKVLGQSSK